jgi:hypothetical protein
MNIFQKLGEFECAVLLAVLVGLALALALTIWRRKRTERKLRIELANLGNIETGYWLRLEDPTGELQVRFIYKRKLLPLVSAASAAPAPAAAYAFAPAGEVPDVSPPSTRPGFQGFNLAGSLSSMLTSLGSFLPGQFGRPLMRAGGRISSMQMKTRYYQGKAGRTQAFFSGGKRAQRVGTAPAEALPVVSELWAVTPPVSPGEKLQIQILLRSGWAQQDQIWPFRLLSGPAETASLQPVIQEGQIQTRGGFFSHPLYPQMLVFALSAVVLLTLFYMKNNGVWF